MADLLRQQEHWNVKHKPRTGREAYPVKKNAGVLLPHHVREFRTLSNFIYASGSKVTIALVADQLLR